MTQPSPRRDPSTQESDSSQPRDMSHDPTNCLRPAADVASDNDTSEKPVREKLKKTSIASISQHATKSQESGIHVDSSPMPKVNSASSSDKKTGNTGMDPIRGRPVKKRSYDDLDLLETDTNIIGASASRDVKSNGHARKRSRDVRAGEPLKGDRQPRAVGSTVQEEAEDASNRVETAEVNVAPPPESPRQMEVEQYATSNDRVETSHHDIGIVVDEASSETGKDPTDQEMRDSASSPRKKRSRDQFDSDADREQKIPATEEARAQRRSDELERAEVARTNSEDVVLPKIPAPSEQESKSAREGNELMAIEAEASSKSNSGTLGSISVLSTPSANARSVSPSKPLANPYIQTSSAGFASSGFAALSSSATSPFGALGASSTTATGPGSLVAPATVNSKHTESFTEMETNKTDPAINGGFGAFAKKSSSNFGTTIPSPFGASSATKGGVFGGSIFGGGFRGGFVGGGKLTNFAAPTGDAKLGTFNGAIKPIGSPTHEADDGKNSEDEGEGPGENDKDGDDEVDGRFQHKDVETGEDEEVCLFSSRASLYTFKGKNWREAGKGVFKLNISAMSTDDPDPEFDADQKKGRFIMRAQQTFRVLLNAPVLKGMKMNEPTGKSVSFGVLEDSKVVIYMVKLADPTESKKLYHEVRKLQENMSGT